MIFRVDFESSSSFLDGPLPRWIVPPMKIAILLCALTIGTVSLAASPPAEPKGDVGLGEKLRLGSIRIRPLSVVEDSRCPVEVKCGRPNRIVVRTEVRGPTSTKTRNFELGETREVEGAGGLMLAAVSPSPLADATIPSAAYRFTYQIR